MPQISTSLTINNGAATPVAKTFAPTRVSPELSLFQERSATVSAGFVDFVLRFSPATSVRSTNRIDYEVKLPVMQTVDGVQKVAHTGIAKGYFVIPDLMLASDRWDLHAYVVNGLNNAVPKLLFRDLDAPY